jgi:tyrosine-protein kinase
METAQGSQEMGAIRDYARILWQRKWIALIPIVLVPLAALYFSFKQERLYEATSSVVVRNQNATLNALGIPGVYEDPARFLETEVQIARSPAVARRVVDASPVEMTSGEFLAESSASSQTDANILVFNVTDENPDTATQLANLYAVQFALYKRQKDTAGYRRGVDALNRQLDQIGPQGRRSPLFETYQQLLASRQNLQTAADLQGANTRVVRLASGAGQIQPTPRRNAALGLGLGIFLGIGLAFLWHAFDTRVRNSDQVTEALGLTLLARIPAPPRRLRRSGNVSMLVDPGSVQAEAFRVLRTNLEFANLTHAARTIMLTSAVEQEGKSTTAVNTAVALARAGKRVVLVDLDLRRPMIDRIFALEDRPGITDVAIGHATLDEAVTTIALSDTGEQATQGNGRKALLEGVLEVVTSGPIPPNPGEFMGSVRLQVLMEELRNRAEIVVIDTAPILRVGDAMALSPLVDGIVVLARLNVLRRPMLRDLKRMLDATPTPKIGIVLTGAESEAGYEYRRYYRRRGVGRRERQKVA